MYKYVFMVDHSNTEIKEGFFCAIFSTGWVYFLRAVAVIMAFLMKGTHSRLTFALQADTGAGDAPRLLLLLRFREAQCRDRSISSRQVKNCLPGVINASLWNE